MHPEWAESLLEQCQEAGVPFLFKQWGNWGLVDQVGEVGKHKVVQLMRQNGAPVDLVNLGKSRTGRELLGRKWDELPAV